MRVAHPLIAFVLAAVAGCGGSNDCPALSVDMQSLAAQASSIEFDIYDSSTSCAGNDVAADAPAPVVTRRLDGHDGTTLQLPAGQYVVVLHAFDANGAFIGSACQSEVFSAGQRACVSVTLSTPTIDGDGGIPDLANGGSGGGPDMARPFTAQTSGVTTTLYQAWSPGGGVAYVAGAGGVMLKTTNSGTTWSKQTTNSSQDLEAVWGTSATDLYAAGLRGTLLHTSDGGTTWKSVSLGGTQNALYDVWGASATDVYVVGDRGTVFHGSGSSFTTVSTPAGQTPINCVWGASGSDVFLYGGGGLILHGSAAASFTKPTSPTSDFFNYGWGSAQDVWIPSMNSSGTSSSLWHSGDDGASWQSQLTTATALWAVWSTAAGDAFLVGGDILESTDHGAHWNSVGTAPATLFGVGGDPSGSDIYTVGANGTIMHR